MLIIKHYMATVGGPAESSRFGWYKDSHRKARKTEGSNDDRLPSAIQRILGHKARSGTLTPEEEEIRDLVGARLLINELMASKQEEVDEII